MLGKKKKEREEREEEKKEICLTLFCKLSFLLTFSLSPFLLSSSFFFFILLFSFS